MTNTVDTLTQIADHASRQSDRWLFVALLALVLIAVVFSGRWLIRDRDRLVSGMEKVLDKQMEMTERVAGVIATNTEALHRVSEEIRFCANRGPRPPASLSL